MTDKSRHVLVVDDDHGIRYLVSEALTVAGCTVEEAEDGCAALALVATTIFDVVVLDMQMPCMDGRAFLERYGEREGRRALWICDCPDH